MQELDELERAALVEAAKAKTLEDISTAASTLKTLAEARTALGVVLTGKRAYALEVIKSLSAFLVPLVSLLALTATVIIQQKQIEASRQQIENSEWRDLLGSMKGSSDAVYTDLTIAPRLTSFASSTTYGDQAKAIAARFMGHLSNPDGFRELFSYVFPNITSDNISAVLDVARALGRSRIAVENACISTAANEATPKYVDILTWCGITLDDKAMSDLMKQTASAREIADNRRKMLNITSEARFLTNELSSFLHGPVGHSSSTATLDFSYAYLAYGDFSHLDVSHWNVSNTIFDNINLADSDLRTGNFTGVEFRLSNWWDARYISPALLFHCIRWWPPKFHPLVQVNIASDVYTQKVRLLCDRSGIECPSDIPFQATTAAPVPTQNTGG
jgi:uncharacterized protein YjbI with pentapeptide repeats